MYEKLIIIMLIDDKKQATTVEHSLCPTLYKYLGRPCSSVHTQSYYNLACLLYSEHVQNLHSVEYQSSKPFFSNMQVIFDFSPRCRTDKCMVYAPDTLVVFVNQHYSCIFRCVHCLLSEGFVLAINANCYLFFYYNFCCTLYS